MSTAAFEKFAVCGDDADGERYLFAAHCKGAAHSAFQPAAAGHLHARHGDGAYVVGGEYLREFFRVVHGVELGAAHQRDARMKSAWKLP